MRAFLPYILTGIIIPLVGLGIYYFQSRVRVNEQRDSVGIQSQATPLQILTQQLASKDAQLVSTQGQFFTFMQTQMARNEAQTKALDALTAECRAQTTALMQHTEQSAFRSKAIHERLNSMAEDLAEVKVQTRRIS
jgi:hypothetical protein